jgi:coenzyme F420-0:L-glutamate ligase / coenzyme F420-1:gamma-L-glutamate ligase
MNVTTRAIESNPHSLLRRRRSIRHYEPQPPTAEVLDRIFVSVGLAPSAHNRQPWRFFVIANRDLKVGLADVMGSRLASDRRRDGDPEEAIAKDVSRSFLRITNAPIVIIVALTLADMDHYPDPARARAEWLMAVQSTAMAGQNLLLAAEEEGLGACWMCAPLFCEAEVKRALSLPDDWELQGLITLGFTERLGPLKVRKPLSEFVVFA